MKQTIKKIIKGVLTLSLVATMFMGSMTQVTAAPVQGYREFGILPSTQVTNVQLMNGQLQPYGIPAYTVHKSFSPDNTVLGLCNDSVARVLEAMHACQTGELTYLSAEDGSGIFVDSVLNYSNHVPEGNGALLYSRLVQNYTEITVFPYYESTDTKGGIEVAVRVTDGSYLLFHVEYCKDPALRYEFMDVYNVEDTTYVVD